MLITQLILASLSAKKVLGLLRMIEVQRYNRCF